MDKEIIIRQFDEIEQKVERLIGVCKTQEVTISDLNNRIKELEGVLQAKNSTEKNLMDERELIRSKIDHILGRLDDISES